MIKLGPDLLEIQKQWVMKRWLAEQAFLHGQVELAEKFYSKAFDKEMEFHEALYSVYPEMEGDKIRITGGFLMVLSGCDGDHN